MIVIADKFTDCHLYGLTKWLQDVRSEAVSQGTLENADRFKDLAKSIFIYPSAPFVKLEEINKVIKLVLQIADSQEGRSVDSLDIVALSQDVENALRALDLAKIRFET